MRILILAMLPVVLQAEWWTRTWSEKWVQVTVEGKQYDVLTRRVGNGPKKLFCMQGGPGGLFWDLNFLAVYLDLSKFEVIQYDRLGDQPSPCSLPSEPCAADTSWMTLNGFVETMDQVHRALEVPSDAIIIGHSFGVIETLEFLLRWPTRAGGAVLSDWVASTDQSARRIAWCDANGWRLCKLYKPSKTEPWRKMGLTNHLLGHVTWGPTGNGTGGFLETWDVRDRLQELAHIPTLSFASEFDIVFPADVREMSEKLGGQYSYIADAGHFSFVDHQRQWLDSFHSWLDSVEEPPSQTREPRRKGCGLPTIDLSPGSAVPQELSGRRYFLRLPSGYASDVPHSLVLSFHGLASQPSDAPFYAQAPSVPANVIFAFPEGLADDPSGLRSWNGSGSVGSPGPSGHTCDEQSTVKHACHETCVAQGGCTDNCWLTTCADDVGFVSAVLDDIQTRFCVDDSAVHVVGFSGGGWFSLELGTNPLTADRFQSIVSISGVPFLGFNREPQVRPGARFAGFWGSQDNLVPAYATEGRVGSALARTGWIFETWENTTRQWANALDCGELLSATTLKPSSDTVHCLDYDCSYGSVSACLWDGPHAIPPGGEDLAWQVFFPGIEPVALSREMSSSPQVETSQLFGIVAVAGVLWVVLAATRYRSRGASALESVAHPPYVDVSDEICSSHGYLRFAA